MKLHRVTILLNTFFSINYSRYVLAIFLLAIIKILSPPVLADSSSPLLAAYYDNFLAVCGTTAYAWRGFDSPRQSHLSVRQVGVGKLNRYVLTNQNKLLAWEDDPGSSSVLMEDVQSFYAGRSGLFVIRNDNSLWSIPTTSLLGFGENISDEPLLIANKAITAAVGDSANYYVTPDGGLYVRGLAHRGQYGDGKLTSTNQYIKTFEEVIQVVSHTGHALVLKKDGTVWGTGGNIYGPLGNHGYGDKAIQWGLIKEGAVAIATGSSHSLAIDSGANLWIWGRNEGLEPKKVMSSVVAVAAGSRSSIAIANNGLWQWSPGEQPKKVMECK